MRRPCKGSGISRPPISQATRRKIAELNGRGVSIKRIAKELRIAYGTAWNYIKRASRFGPYLLKSRSAGHTNPYTI